jgi:LuxR family transcriptional regulator, maltose regulon positive regulatory protein
MAAPILATKLYKPPLRALSVRRPHLIARLNEGLRRKLTLVAAPAGFGKTTLVSEWVASCARPVAWLSLDEGDNDPARFLSYLVTALRTVAPGIGEGTLRALQSPQPPPLDTLLTSLLNEIAAVPESFVLVLDDYHVIDAKAVDGALTFLIEHQPPQMHLFIATREDPQLPLARLRARGELTELRVADLRFTPAEAAEFLNGVMGLSLSEDDIGRLEARTEGWIAGLQLAAVSMQGRADAAAFIEQFTGSHRFVMDYLVEEVLQQQPESVQRFLLHSSILARMCGPLCEAVLLDPPGSGQATLEYLERANLFTIPLDSERRWYRYHHLFGDLLRQQLRQLASRAQGEADPIADGHIRASRWYEENGFDIEAFQHAAAANDIDRAERLAEGRGVPLHMRGAVHTIIDWLASLPKEVLDARPSLWWRHGAMMLVVGQTIGVEEKFKAAEDALQKVEPTDRTRSLVGQIAAARATLALTRYDVETMIAQSHRALEYLPPNYRSMRANAHWTLGMAHAFAGDRRAARESLLQAIEISKSVGDRFTTILATIGLGLVQELDNELHQAAETHRSVLAIAGDQPLQIIYEAHLGMARILYEWNNLDVSEEHAQRSLFLARQYEKIIDRYILCEIQLARLKLARGDLTGAASILEQTSREAQERRFVHRLPEVAAAQVPVLLRQGDLAGAADLAHRFDLPLSRARVALARGSTGEALQILEGYLLLIEERGWHDERLKATLLQAVAFQAHSDEESAMRGLSNALTLAEPGGFVRLFIDEGDPVVHLLKTATSKGIMPGYVARLLAACEAEAPEMQPKSAAQPLAEPLSQREIEVLELIAQGLSNSEIGERLFLALDTVKGHNQRIFAKLQVGRRTEAVARARELGIL